MKTKLHLFARIFAVAMTLTSLIFVSCDKNDANESPFLQRKVVNPYTSVGIAHNGILYSLGEEIQDTLDYYAAINPMTEKQKDSICARIVSILPTVSREYYELNSLDTTTQHAVNLILGCMLSSYIDSAFCEFLAAPIIESILNNMDFSDNSSDIIDEFDTHIDDMLANGENDVALFLTVMKYSYSFWEDARTDVTNPWYNFINAHTFFSNPAEKGLFKNAFNALKSWWEKNIRPNHVEDIPKPIQVCAYDAAGALLGVPLASVTNGTSVVVGAVFYSALAIIRL